MEECQIAPIRRIMVPLDLSSYSEITFAYALSLAKYTGAHLILVNVINARMLEAVDRLSAQGYDIGRRHYVENLIKEREAIFQKDYLPRTQGVNAKLVFKEGLPWEQLLKAIKEESVDMVVMGTKGRTDLAHTLFGSTAEKVFRHSPCPVVSVRGPEHCKLAD